MKGRDFIYFVKGLLFIGIVSYLFFDNLIFIFLLSPYLYFYIKECRKDYDNKQNLVLLEQFKDGIVSVSFSLNVGYSVENSFREAATEIKRLYGSNSNIAREFDTIVKRIDRNENLEDIIENFAVRTQLEDIKYFAEIFRYAKRSGGDIVSIIRNTAVTIRDKIEVKKEIDTVISGKKMEQRVMSYVPFAIILYLKVTSNEFIEPLYANITGIAVMTVCLAIYFASDYLGKRIVSIEV